MQKSRVVALFLRLCLPLATPLFGQAGEVRFQQLSVSNGLSDQYINCIFQDSRGFLWIGTANGLNRYDGYHFTVYEYSPTDSNSLSSNWVQAAVEDEQGYLWVGTEKGLNRWDPRTGMFHRVHHSLDSSSNLQNAFITALHPGRKGGVWIGCRGGGLLRYVPDTGKFERYDFTGGNVSHPEAAVQAILEDDQGVLWLGAWRNGLFRYNPATGESTHYFHQPGNPRSLSHNSVQAIYKDSRDRLWAGTRGGGLNRFDPESGTFTVYHHSPGNPRSLSHNTVLSLCESSQGQIWAGTHGGGLNLLSPENGAFQRYRAGGPYQLNNDAVRALFVDREGILWVGTSNGLNYLSPRSRKFKLYQNTRTGAERPASNSVWAVHQNQPGFIWAGTFNGKLFQVGLDSGSFRAFEYAETPPGEAQSPVYALWASRDGGLWIGTLGNGLHYLPEKGGKALHYYRADSSYSISSDVVFSLYEDPSGVLWVGTNNGLNRYDKATGRFKLYLHQPGQPNSLSDNVVWDIMKDSKGYLWLATNGGLNRFAPDKEEFIHYLHDPSDPQSLSYNAVRSVYEDSRGRIWAGTRDGLNLLLPDGKGFISYHTEDGLSSDIIYGILEDGSGQAWVSTPRGLSCLNTGQGQIRNFGAGDGLQGASFNVGACWKSPFTGRLFFGGDNGLNAFYPEDIQVDSIPPPVAITAVRAFRPGRQEAPKPIRLVPGQEELRFSYRDDILTFEFAALSFSKPEENRYAYRLEGGNAQWAPLGTDNKITFTNLAPGTYTLQVKGSNGDGIWNEEGAGVRFTIVPPWWQSLWAKGFYLLMLAGVLWLIYRWRTRVQRRQIRWQQKELEREKQVSERLRQVDRLKDQFLANTSHELRTPLQGIIGLSEGLYHKANDTESREDLSMLISSGKRLSSLVDDILDFAKLKNFDLELHRKAVALDVLAEVVIRNNRPLIQGKTIQLINGVPENLPTAHGDENRLQQVLYNLVGNAIKFTEQGHIRIGARLKEDNGTEMLEMYVEDTGIGIPEEQQDIIFQEFEQGDGSAARKYAGTGLGLSISRRLAELHGGSMWVESEVGRGSTFFFTLPVSGAQASSGLDSRPLTEVSHVMPAPVLARNDEGRGASTGILPNPGNEKDKIRILVVDDEPVNQQVLKNHLSSGIYELVQAMNGEEAIRHVQSGQAFDLVLLDVMMPRMSGYEVCRKIREKHLPSELPVIMVTAKNQVEDLVQGLSLGANDYLAKPFSREEFLARIQTHIDLHRIFDVTERFIPNEFIRSLGRQRITEVELGDFAEREVTVFFSDIRDYTTLAETMTPEQNYRFVNAYNGRMGPIIRENGGFVNQYLGDAIMSIFPESTAGALRDAIEMQQALHIYIDERLAKERAPVRIGAGLHSGPLIMGIIGDRRRMDAATISDTVNTASRIESLTKHFGASILLSEDSLKGITNQENFSLRFLGKVLVKGKREAVGIYECFDGDLPAVIERKQATLALFREGRQHYLDGNFKEAMEALEEVLRANPDDVTTQLFLNRIANYLAHGKPEGWTGVEMMEEK